MEWVDRGMDRTTAREKEVIMEIYGYLGYHTRTRLAETLKCFPDKSFLAIV